MSKKFFIITQSLLITFFSIFIAISAFATVSKVTSITNTTTIVNLNKAMKSEANAAYKYDLFAKKAEEEGYNQIAKLFRAVSMAESVHRNNHKATILIYGGKPEIIKYEFVEVQPTKENLKTPLKAENYEQEVIYPSFINRATLDKMPVAIKSFNYAKLAEKQHEKLFREALDDFGKNASVNYCVSRITGATYSKKPNLKCPKGKWGSGEEYILIK